MKTYKLEDIFKFAFNIEQDGEKFYQEVSSLAKNAEFKKIFNYLKNQEVKHAKTFLKFYNIYSKKKSFFPTDERFEDLLDAISLGMLFPDISEVRDMLSKDNEKDIVSIIKIAMNVETNTIAFYQKIKELLSRQRQVKSALDKIIREEESHLIKLRNLRLDLDPYYAGISFGKFF